MSAGPPGLTLSIGHEVIRFDLVPPLLVLPEHLHGIRCYFRVLAEQYALFHLGLSNEEPVKWVVVMVRQLGEFEDVVSTNVEYGNTIPFLLVLHDLWQGLIKCQFAKFILDLDFP
jgi:hypothetical protein